MKKPIGLIITVLYILLSNNSYAQDYTIRSCDTTEISHLEIRKTTIIHCARGPVSCEKCKESAKVEKFCLLKIYTKSNHLVSRPVIESIVDDKKFYFEYEIVKHFDSQTAAKKYSKERNIKIVDPVIKKD